MAVRPITPPAAPLSAAAAAQPEFFFDCSSPWTYLAFVGIRRLRERLRAAPAPGGADVQIHWKPILVGGVFNEVNPQVYEYRANPNPVRQRYTEKDLRDWARYYGLRMGWPPMHPVNSVRAMRGALVAQDAGLLEEYAVRVFDSYWGYLEDISQPAVLVRIAGEIGIKEQDFFAAIGTQSCKDRLRANTDELVRRGGFGSPTMFLGEDMYFGNDRLPLLEHALRGRRA